MDELLEILRQFWPHLVVLLYFACGVPAAMHAILSRRDVRSAVGWVGLIWLTPIVGAVLYVLLGINRIQRAALRLRANQLVPDQPHHASETPDATLWQILEAGHGHFTTLARLVQHVTNRPLVAGNEIEPLVGGDEAYPAMLQAIDAAEHSIGMSSYIFDRDSAGLEFVAALRRAVERGVEVRVLVDSVGARYSFPSIFRNLRQARVRAAAFLPALAPTMIRFFNLRNHRKLLIIDGQIGFTGGMNIRAGNMLSRPSQHHVRDIHFRLAGPVVEQLQEVFAVDWHFTTQELLAGPRWFPQPREAGQMLARGVADGPDDDIDRIQLAFMGALSCARRRVVIMTPYFLPETPLIDALNVCSMRGVDVDVILPSANNLPYMTWAMMATAAPLLERGVRIWLTPPPFDHSKVMVVDDVWSSFGSSNWDPRSLRLNFEFNVECYDPQLAARLSQLAADKLAVSRPLTQKEIDARSLPVKLRDGLVRLGLPYL